MKEESVWDYPRPPKLEEFKGHIRIQHKGLILVDTNRAYRILETSHPPTYYLPFADINENYLIPNEHQTYCEFKGTASYFDLKMKEDIVRNIGWYYQNPNKRYAALKDHVCFYASKLDKCLVNNEEAYAQEGDFYGGWITSNIKGPFKGGAGTFGW